MFYARLYSEFFTLPTARSPRKLQPQSREARPQWMLKGLVLKQWDVVSVLFGLLVTHRMSFHCLFLDFFRETALFLEYKLFERVFRMVLAFLRFGGL